LLSAAAIKHGVVLFVRVEPSRTERINRPRYKCSSPRRSSLEILVCSLCSWDRPSILGSNSYHLITEVTMDEAAPMLQHGGRLNDAAAVHDMT